MSNVLTFAPRPKVAVPVEPAPMEGAEIRTRLGEALQTALDAADHILAVLDRMDGDTDAEDGGDAEPALFAPENHHGSQVVWLCGNDGDRETEAPEILLPVVRLSPVPRFRPADFAPEPLAWGGSGNVVAAAGMALLNMVGGRRSIRPGPKHQLTPQAAGSPSTARGWRELRGDRPKLQR